MMRFFFHLILLLLIISCKSEAKKDAISTSEAKESKVQNLINLVTRNSSLPRLFANDNRLYLSWVEKVDTVATLRYAVRKNDLWRDPQEIISGSNWFVNWADFPAIAESNGNILTSFLQKSAAGTYTYDVKLNLYTPSSVETLEGKWKKNFILHNDGTQSEHGFVSIRPYVGNSFVVVWLDGRDTVGKHLDKLNVTGHGGGQMTLRAAIVFEDGTINYDTLLDERVCDCCQTALTIGPQDEIIVAYRDRSEDEIRDISVVRWEMETGWSKPMTIGKDNWKIAGCPVNGPSIDAKEKSIGLAWFTGVEGEGKVNLAFSTDTGVTFGAPIRIDAGNATGRVDIQMISTTEAAVLWMEPNGDDELIQLIKVNLDGSKGEPITISKTNAERASGFPQLELLGDKLYVAWTVVLGGTSTIETASILTKTL